MTLTPTPHPRQIPRPWGAAMCRALRTADRRKCMKIAAAEAERYKKEADIYYERVQLQAVGRLSKGALLCGSPQYW